MIVFNRIFLTLLVPLLVRGALAPSPPNGNPPSTFDWPPRSHKLYNSELPPLVARNGLAPILPPVHGSQGTNPAQPIDFTNTNLSPYPMPQIVPIILTGYEFHTTCAFPTGTYYRVPRSPSTYQLRKTDRTENDRVVIMSRGESHETFLVPKGSRIEISSDGDAHIPSSGTRIRNVDQEDVNKVVAFCTEIYDGTAPEPELESLQAYVLRCSDINFWNIGLGDFVKVAVKRKNPNLLTHCTLPLGTTYHTLLNGRAYPLWSTLMKEDRIALTPQKEIVLLPEGTTVHISGDRIDVPPSNTEIQIVAKHDETGIKEWCKMIHSRAKVPPGWNREKFGSYVLRCSDTNYWHITGGDFVVVPVNAHLKKKHRDTSQFQPGRYLPYPAVRPVARN